MNPDYWNTHCNLHFVLVQTPECTWKQMPMGSEGSVDPTNASGTSQKIRVSSNAEHSITPGATTHLAIGDDGPSLMGALTFRVILESTNAISGDYRKHVDDSSLDTCRYYSASDSQLSLGK